MIEIPEAINLSAQLDEALKGKVIESASAASHPHKFAWYSGDPADYAGKLTGRTVTGSYSVPAKVFLTLDDGNVLIFGEGTRLSLFAPGEKTPAKHQLMLKFTDGYTFTLSIQMYGFIFLENPEKITNNYVLVSLGKPDPLGDEFTEDYFLSCFDKEKDTKLSAKAFLATDQRFPGLGNGVLQDILYNAKIHPALKLRDFNEEEPYNLYNSVRITLKEMTEKGGRDTEKDLYGNNGGYESVMSRNTVGTGCPSCGAVIEKKSYLGGSIYFCPECQRKG